MLVKLATFASCMVCASLAQAQFAVVPPDEPTPGFDETAPAWPDHDSVVRARVGPTLRIAEEGATGGLATALDFGRWSGVRVSAAWTALGGSAMHAQYGGDLWLSLDLHPQLRPVFAAGAAYVRAETAETEADPDSNAEPEAYHFGVATARVGVEYLFDLATADARLGAEAVGAVPAINAQDRSPWLGLSANLALGF